MDSPAGTVTVVSQTHGPELGQVVEGGDVKDTPLGIVAVCPFRGFQKYPTVGLPSSATLPDIQGALCVKVNVTLAPVEFVYVDE